MDTNRLKAIADAEIHLTRARGVEAATLAQVCRNYVIVNSDMSLN